MEKLSFINSHFINAVMLKAQTLIIEVTLHDKNKCLIVFLVLLFL